MADLEGLDQAALEEKMKAAESYEDRAAIRKALREIKKRQGLEVGGNKKRGSSQYNRFAGGAAVKATSKLVSQSFVPSQSPIPSSSTPPPPLTHTPPPPSSPSLRSGETESEKREREEEIKRRDEREIEEKEERERQEREREEREREREEREEREREREEREKEREEREREEREREREEREEREREREERRKQREQEREEREREEREREREEREEREREREERRKQREQEREEREREALEKEREREERQQKLKEQEESDRGVEGEDEREDEEEEIDTQNTDHQTTPQDDETEEQGEQEDTDGSYDTKRGGQSTKTGTEFQKFQLRKTDSGGGGGSKSVQVNTHDFGVKLKPRPHTEETPPTTKSSTSSQQSSSWKTATPPSTRRGGGGGGAPRTLADFQKLANRGKPTDTPPTSSRTDKKTLIMSYVNAALEVRPPISSDHALYQLCSRPSNLCKLINKSVRGTVDLRALTKTPPPSASSADKAEALEENMILVVESARSIGCSVTEDMEQLLAQGNHTAIDKLLIELIKSRVVHMPGMEDEPSSTFNDLSTLMSKLGLSPPPPPQDDIDQGGEGGEGEGLTWKEKDSQPLREKLAAQNEDSNKSQNDSSTWKEDKNKKTSEIDLSKPSFDGELSYEERAALRRAEREKKRREREGYATPK